MYFARYWVQTIRFLARGKLTTGRGVQLTSDRREYTRGEPVELRVRFLDGRLAPAGDEVDRGHRIAGPSAASRDASSQPGRRKCVCRHIRRFRRKANTTSCSPNRKSPAPRRPFDFAIVAPPGELARPIMDAAALTAAAETTHGKFYKIANADRAAHRPPRRPPRAHRKPAAHFPLEPLVAARRVPRLHHHRMDPAKTKRNALNTKQRRTAEAHRQSACPPRIPHPYPHSCTHSHKKSRPSSAGSHSAHYATAACWTAATLLAAALALGLADYLVRFRDPGLRIMATAALVAVAVWAAYRWWYRPGRKRLGPLAVARKVESHFPQLNDSLASAIEFLQQSEDDQTAGSAQLRRLVVAEAETAIGRPAAG